MRVATAVGVSILLVAAPAAAQRAPAAAKPAPPAPDRKICRDIAATGTMFPKHICLTASEWREFAAVNASSADKALSGRAVRGRMSVGDDGS